MGFTPSVAPLVASEESPALLGGDGLDDLFGDPELAVDDDDLELESAEVPVDVPTFEPTRSRNITVEIPRSTLFKPRSRYDGFTTPLPPVYEWLALKDLMGTIEGKPTKEEFVEFELDQFCFYIRPQRYKEEMRPLHHMSTRVGHTTFYVDGIISSGDIKHFIAEVEVVEVPIGNYGTSSSSVDDQIWIRTKLNSREKIYYKLKTPAIEYERFHTPFLWVADLAKHVVDYCDHKIQKRQDVTLMSFQSEFIEWILKVHKRSHLERWLRQHPSTDFRTSVVANLEFIWKELNGVLSHKKIKDFGLFSEAKSFSQYKAVPSLTQPEEMVIRAAPKNEREAPTIVTPYIKECFGHMAIGQMLRLAGDDEEISLPDVHIPKNSEAVSSFLSREEVAQIKVGDVLATPRDEENPIWGATILGHAVDDGRWFGLVQRVHVTKQGHRDFDVRWLYRPADTLCSILKYPWPNELFLSDNCTCEDGPSSRIKEDQILGVVPVNWFGNPNNSGNQLFVRQMYLVENRRWVTLEKTHLRCSHSDKEKPRFRTGDTILAVIPPSDPSTLAEPYEVVKVFKQNDNVFTRLRRLVRRQRADPDASKARPNELVYTEELTVYKVDNIEVIGHCHVRFFKNGTPIPCPYDRDGTGNYFFITHRLLGGGEFVPFTGAFPGSLRQGFDPSQSTPKLKGLDLFCGAGNFGRGLEESGVVEMRWANDIWDKAIHTYMANTPNPKTTHPFLGSIDDLLRKAIQGDFSDQVPRPGEVDLISAGSPCPGFSLLTADKSTLKQIKNRSLIASFASFVDFYRPKYAILENVSTIIQAKKNREQDILCQLFCALLGMGYQAQLVLGDAWSHGAPQTRNRVFLCIAAPGYRLPEAPLLSHSHYPGVTRRALGDNANVPFVERQFGPTAFKYVTAEESTRDLPPIYDGKPDCCPGFPDHRLVLRSTSLLEQVVRIPVHPYGMNFAKAWYGMKPSTGKGGQGVMSAGDRESFPETGQRVSNIAQGFARQHPNELFKTVTTSSNPTDARCAGGLHWREPRALSLMEVRRAQGFLDHEVLLGSLLDQWKLVGNSVARPMALALGLKLREAWLGSLPKETLERAAGGGRKEESQVLPEYNDRVYESTPPSGSRNPSDAEEVSEAGDSTPATEVEAVVKTVLSVRTGTKRRLPEDTAADKQWAKTRRVPDHGPTPRRPRLGMPKRSGQFYLQSGALLSSVSAR